MPGPAHIQPTPRGIEPSALKAILAGLILLILAGLCSSCRDLEKRRFDIPAGLAAQTLREFAKQAEAEIIYKSPGSADVRTNAVAGTMSPANALGHMLAGTPLVYHRELETGAYAVTVNRESLTATPTVGQ